MIGNEQNPSDLLFYFARQGRWADVNNFLAQNKGHLCFSVDYYNSNCTGYTLIDHAAIQGNIEQILYLKNHYHVNFRPSFTVLTYLLTADGNGCNTIGALFENGLIDINQVYNLHGPKLMTLYDFLQINNRFDLAQWLTRNFGALSYGDIVKWDMFCCASEGKWHNVYSYIQNGADPKMHYEGLSLLHHACLQRNAEVVRVLKENYHLDAITLLATTHPKRWDCLAFYIETIPSSPDKKVESLEIEIRDEGIQSLEPEKDPVYNPKEERSSYRAPIVRPK